MRILISASLFVYEILFLSLQIEDITAETFDIYLNSYVHCGHEKFFEVSPEKEYLIKPDISPDTGSNSFRQCEVTFHSHRSDGHICLIQEGNGAKISDKNAELKIYDGLGNPDDKLIGHLKPYPDSLAFRDVCSTSRYITLFLSEIKKTNSADIRKLQLSFRIVDIRSNRRKLYLDGISCNNDYDLLDSKISLINRPHFPGMMFPSTEAEWKDQAILFEKRWHFPNCVGAVDGKHIAIHAPPESGSFYYNYKGFNSIVLMAVANADYQLLYVNVGTNGRVSDGGVIANTDFYKKLCNGSLNLPGDNPDNGLPYAFISDEAFALREDFLKPYNVKILDQEKRIFNYRLSRARRVVENVFGIMVARFGVLSKKINQIPENIDDTVLACCALHNFLRKNSSASYTPPDSLDYEDPCTHEMQDGLRVGDNIAGLANGKIKNAPERAKHVREQFKMYFNTVGKVAWQDKYAV